MGEFNKDQGQTDQTGQRTDKSAFGQFDKGQNQQDQSERGQQDRQDFEGADSGIDKSSSREQMGTQGGQQMDQDRSGQQGDFGGQNDQKGGFGGQREQGQNQNRGQQQQDDNQYQSGKDQGDDQNR